MIIMSAQRSTLELKRSMIDIIDTSKLMRMSKEAGGDVSKNETLSLRLRLRPET